MRHNRYSDFDDALLTKEIRSGRTRAFEELYDRYHRSLFYMAKNYVKDPALAEDAVQDVYVRLWQKRENLDPARSIRSFLFTMLRNRLLNMLRDRKREILSVYELHESSHPFDYKTDEEVALNEYQEIVNEGLDKLPDRKREIFELKVAGLTNAQIAEKLLISIHTVKSQYYHGTQFMRGFLKDRADIVSLLLILLF